MEAVLISNKFILSESEATLLSGGLKSCMYIPIANGYSRFISCKGSKSDINQIPKILGYLYLETDNTLNNFNEKVLKKHINLINFLALLCEKYILRKISSVDKDIIHGVKPVSNLDGIFTIAWEDVSETDLVIGLPIWNSILVVPIIQMNKVKGLIYLVVSTNSKEFGINDLNFVNVFSNLLHV